MKNLLLITSIILLTSCGSDDDQGQLAGDCSASKAIASVWTRDTDGATFDITGTEPGTTYQLVVTDDGTCDALDGELYFEYYTNNKTYYEQTCDGSTTTLYDYNISCDNVLTITERATGDKTTFR